MMDNFSLKTRKKFNESRRQYLIDLNHRCQKLRRHLQAIKNTKG